VVKFRRVGGEIFRRVVVRGMVDILHQQGRLFRVLENQVINLVCGR
jgi:hypothetical protein